MQREVDRLVLCKREICYDERQKPRACNGGPGLCGVGRANLPMVGDERVMSGELDQKD